MDNGIGLAVFGRETRLIQEATSDYELVIELIGNMLKLFTEDHLGPSKKYNLNSKFRILIVITNCKICNKRSNLQLRIG